MYILLSILVGTPSLSAMQAPSSQWIRWRGSKLSGAWGPCVGLCRREIPFHQYLYGKHFKLNTDTQAIVFIYETSAENPQPGSKDGYYGCCPTILTSHTRMESTTRRMTYRTTPANDGRKRGQRRSLRKLHRRLLRAKSVDENADCREDADMQTLTRAIRTDNPGAVKDSVELRGFLAVFPQLFVSGDGVILRQYHIVIPRSLRNKLVDVAHEGHLGSQTKKLMRLKVWFDQP